MWYIKLFIEREKNIGQSVPECPFNPFRTQIFQEPKDEVEIQNSDWRRVPHWHNPVQYGGLWHSRKKTHIEKCRLWWNHWYKFHVINTKLLQLASRPVQPTSGTGIVALHSTVSIHFFIICCISLMDGILKRSFSNLMPWGTNETEAYYSSRGQGQGTKVRGRGRGIENCASRLPWREAMPRGTTSLITYLTCTSIIHLPLMSQIYSNADLTSSSS